MLSLSALLLHVFSARDVGVPFLHESLWRAFRRTIVGEDYRLKLFVAGEAVVGDVFGLSVTSNDSWWDARLSDVRRKHARGRD